MENLPYLDLARIVDFLNYGSRRTCRLVSRKLKNTVDKIGLSIKFDGRKAESTNLNKSLVATEVRIRHLDSYTLEPEEVKYWKTLILSTPVDFTWLNNRMFLNLRVLILHDPALNGKDFTGQSEALIPCFQRLSELHITLTVYGFNENGHPRDRNYCPMASPTEDVRVKKNLVYLLKIIRSGVLKLLFISVHGLSTHVNAIADEKNQWEYEPLFEFLEAHRLSLKTIILPTLEYAQPSGEYTRTLTLLTPIQLKRVQLNNAGVLENRLPQYWTNLLLHQESLEILSISEQCVENSQFPWLPAVLSNNATTLTTIFLQLYSNEMEMDTLDIRVVPMHRPADASAADSSIFAASAPKADATTKADAIGRCIGRCIGVESASNLVQIIAL